MNIRLALYQPDIPQNAGALMRLAACCRVPLEVIEPCGFVWSDRHLRRAGMDYADMATVTRHDSWDAFLHAMSGRIVLLTTRGDCTYTDAKFADGDVLLLGRESVGVPDAVHGVADCACGCLLPKEHGRSMLPLRVRWFWAKPYVKPMDFRAEGRIPYE